MHRTDNQAAAQILSNGSKHPHLHEEAVAVFQLCLRHHVRLHVERVPREQNQIADYLSKIVDTDDWQLNPTLFKEIDRVFGPHTVDRFASTANAQLPRFCSRWLNPGCECVDCFTVSWERECNWLCPPIHLLSRCIRHLLASQGDGLLLLPLWKSCICWPLLCTDQYYFKPFVTDYILLQPHAGMFVQGTCPWNLFSTACPKFEIIVLKICGCGRHLRNEKVLIPNSY